VDDQQDCGPLLVAFDLDSDDLQFAARSSRPT